MGAVPWIDTIILDIVRYQELIGFSCGPLLEDGHFRATSASYYTTLVEPNAIVVARVMNFYDFHPMANLSIVLTTFNRFLD